MPLPAPNLDDRTFQQLVEEARLRISQSGCGWTDLSPGDPGMVLLEVFAYLTELMIYRLNRLPDKAYIEFLRLMGVKLEPPAAAAVRLCFSLSRAQKQPVEIPQGIRVTVARTGGGDEPPTFVTAMPAVIAPEQSEVEVLALHCSQVEGELAGTGTGQPRQCVRVSRPPIIAPTGDDLDLVVGVEASPDELGGRAPALTHGGKSYRIWREVESFTELGPDRFVYLADRASGVITFAPAVRSRTADGRLGEMLQALAEVPPAGREIRLWYRRGGGRDGNVAAETLVVLKDPIPGVKVNNPQPASGGVPAETLDHALARGPQEIHSLHRAVTARDFEALARRGSGSVARAKAFTKADVWKHAKPGTVEVLLVPEYLPLDQRGGGAVTAEKLNAMETEDVRARILASLEERRPLGTKCLVNWVRYKTAQVNARVVVHRGEDAVTVKARVIDRLHQTINPLPTLMHGAGWRFGEPLRASHVYDIVLSEPGVSYVDQVRLLIDEVPEKNVQALAADAYQPDTWYAASGEILFRSLNNGDSWEPAGRFLGEATDSIAVSSDTPGLLAVANRLADERRARVHVSWDCGEKWDRVAETEFGINALSWTIRMGTHVLMMATEKGLYELSLMLEATPVQVLVDSTNPERGYYAVHAFTDVRGGVNLAVAAGEEGGVFLSRQGGKSGSFVPIGMKAEDVRVLGVQREGVRRFLWAGLATPGNEPGKGCFRWELPASPDSVDSPEGWRQFATKWIGGSCRGLGFDGSTVYAATHHAGIAQLVSDKTDGSWRPSSIQCGLPMRGPEHIFFPVDALAVAPSGACLMAGCEQGVYRSRDRAATFKQSSTREFLEKVALPPTWLFCSGRHEVEVVSEDEATQD